MLLKNDECLLHMHEAACGNTIFVANYKCTHLTEDQAKAQDYQL